EMRAASPSQSREKSCPTGQNFRFSAANEPSAAFSTVATPLLTIKPKAIELCDGEARLDLFVAIPPIK
ncbi:hypothetical protein, partial [Rhizobium rhizogenes]